MNERLRRRLNRRSRALRRTHGLLFSLALVFFALRCEKKDNQLNEARRLLDEGAPESAERYIVENKLDLTPEGAHMLLAAFMQSEQYEKAFQVAMRAPERFSRTAITDVCALAAWDAELADQSALAAQRLSNCEDSANSERIDYRAVDFSVNADAADLDDFDRWKELAARLNASEGGPEADTAAEVLLAFALESLEHVGEPERGEHLVGLLREMDTLPLRSELIAWQLSQVERLPDEQKAACLREIDESSGAIIADDPELNEMWQQLDPEIPGSSGDDAPEDDSDGQQGDDPTDDSAENSDESAEQQAPGERASPPGCPLPNFDGAPPSTSDSP